MAYDKESYARYKQSDTYKRRAGSKKFKEQRKGYLWKWNLRTKFNLTPSEYEKMLSAQSNSCPICGIPASFFSRKLGVDHDHKTGKIRGLLCEGCNVGLGHFKDNPNSLRMAAIYLEKHRGD